MPVERQAKVTNSISPDPRLYGRVSDIAEILSKRSERFCTETIKMAVEWAAETIRDPTNRELSYLNALLGSGLHPDEALVSKGMGQSTLLQTAVLARNMQAAEVLLQHGADPTKKDPFGRNAFDYAETAGEGNRQEMLTLLNSDWNAIRALMRSPKPNEFAKQWEDRQEAEAKE